MKQYFYLICLPCSSFVSWPNNVLYGNILILSSIPSSPGLGIVFSCRKWHLIWNMSSTFLCLLWHRYFWSAPSPFNRVFRILHLSNVSSWLDSGYASLAKILRKYVHDPSIVMLILTHQSRCLISPLYSYYYFLFNK